MELIQLAALLSANKNALTYTVTAIRDAKLLKKSDAKIKKQSVLVGLFTDYADLPAVREGVESGERDAPQLPKHIKQSVMVGGVRFWEGHNGTFYLPISLAPTGSHTVWLMDSGEGYVKVDYSDVEPHLLASDKPQPRDAEELAAKHQALFASLPVENIVSVSLP